MGLRCTCEYFVRGNHQEGKVSGMTVTLQFSPFPLLASGSARDRATNHMTDVESVARRVGCHEFLYAFF
jgi:hypothetical protein